ncbi:type II toxin-antitoxin system VapC family toxin [Candidatus Gottesmanbacteria bacterium]|nr:type II toxin-antitoxin system VapC family toxin [Candidatus Gottesmanbacteria bacterium]
MMTHKKYLFVDSSSWISLLVKTDTNYQKAKSIFSSFDTKTTLYISSFIINETVTKIRRMLGQTKAFSLYKLFIDWENEGSLMILPLERKSIDESMKLLQQHPIPNTLSLTDATNIVLMKKHHIPILFSFDRDFKKLKIPNITLPP